MIDHTGCYAADFPASKQFYDAALGVLGYKLLFEMVAADDPTFPTRRLAGYGTKKPDFWLIEVKAEDVRTPNHVAFIAPNHAGVEAFFQAGLAHGGKDNGGPGPRAHYHPGYFGAFLLDPNGNNVEAVTHIPE